MDAHLARMLSSSRQCRCCGGTFAQLLSLSCDRPDIVPGDLEVQDNAAVFATDGDVLTDDFCRFGQLRFLRAVLAIPVADSRGEEFILGTWAGVSEDVFDEYLGLFELRETEAMGSCPAWLSNQIPPESGGPLACMLHMRPEGQYPELQVSEVNSDLARMQELGVGLEELLGFLYAYGHDLASLVYDA
ncbi:DUF2199 domain-containing protein [Phaeobacter sp. HF9A]|uniref:DUF2199 domain-containing protein n=1 Tax=Phaeobacter sp. HF9A TaxID=2721561 RepID=UPI0014316478|nr:DUF2199 domain-containing protein [Phaeobacter sp. HF9A]NIZ15229.1 DUF2199 domain-containing protein [Phaeobacter sp. HF9A]